MRGRHSASRPGHAIRLPGTRHSYATPIWLISTQYQPDTYLPAGALGDRGALLLGAAVVIGSCGVVLASRSVLGLR